jgi:hypothetical protein
MQAKYAGDSNIIMVDGDHTDPRPQFVWDSAVIFLTTTMTAGHTGGGSFGTDASGGAGGGGGGGPAEMKFDEWPGDISMGGEMGGMDLSGGGGGGGGGIDDDMARAIALSMQDAAPADTGANPTEAGLVGDAVPLAGIGDDEVDEALVAQLTTMGFPSHSCRLALEMTHGNVDNAVVWILANAETLPPPADGAADEVGAIADAAGGAGAGGGAVEERGGEDGQGGGGGVGGDGGVAGDAAEDEAVAAVAVQAAASALEADASVAVAAVATAEEADAEAVLGAAEEAEAVLGAAEDEAEGHNAGASTPDAKDGTEVGPGVGAEVRVDAGAPSKDEG